jgi:cytochrome c oxidase subunit IV
MSNLSYEQSKSYAFKLIIFLGIITILEVAIALVGKGYIIKGFHAPLWIMGLLMIALSFYKAYNIVKEYMHLGHEVKAMGMTVVLPMTLLIWAIIAFLWEGAYWNGRRDDARGFAADKNAVVAPAHTPAPAHDTLHVNQPAHQDTTHKVEVGHKEGH